MIKWLVYIALVLLFAPCLSSAKIKNTHFDFVSDKLRISLLLNTSLTDTATTKNSKKQEQEDKKKIKEVAKAKKQPKPEKIEPGDNQSGQKPKQRPKRQRRPEGLERPPEIPRRNGN